MCRVRSMAVDQPQHRFCRVQIMVDYCSPLATGLVPFHLGYTFPCWAFFVVVGQPHHRTYGVQVIWSRTIFIQWIYFHPVNFFPPRKYISMRGVRLLAARYPSLGGPCLVGSHDHQGVSVLVHGRFVRTTRDSGVC